MSVRTRPMFAIPFAINLGSVAVILRQCGFASCNQRAHGPPMFAIPTPDVCRSLQLAGRLHIATAEGARSNRGLSIGVKQQVSSATYEILPISGLLQTIRRRLSSPDGRSAPLHTDVEHRRAGWKDPERGQLHRRETIALRLVDGKFCPPCSKTRAPRRLSCDRRPGARHSWNLYVWKSW